ncbi:unnamed protein product [Rotaria magnacalcarata]|uniref:CCDC92/74 N-terminal domain-containing protein n=2 Tax=Rotaria magnacalcarata TaxID=392030 RepID=A0A816NRZ3_9BILA|nr:unnamed protein product [Rotaria magnacalcarata]CAF2039081.1 unnamed protein product [Rotaria magnacalcarata]CAF4826271.1 unnamed protein product [Rotaria magnacalcarata]
MSEIKYSLTDINTLTQRLQSADKSITFIQREHASTLSNLHEEIAKWQQKCSDLTFQLAIGGGTIMNSTDDNKLRLTIEQLENEIHQCKQTINDLNRIVEEKEKSINDYENRLIVNERKHTQELRLEIDKQRQLKIELEQRSTLIAQLTNQLYREKQLQQQQVQTRARLAQAILPNKPPKFSSTSETQQKLHTLSTKHLSNRSSSLSNRASPDPDLTKALLIKRRPHTPPQQLRPLSSKSIESNDEQLYSKRQRQLLNSHTENIDSNKIASFRPSIKLSAVLPPIVTRKMPLKAMATTAFQQEGEV